MIEVEESIHVPAPREEVFAFMDEPENQAVVTPAITDIRNVESLPNGGKRLDYTYSMAGVDLDGTLETPTYEPGERIVFEMVAGPLSGRITWTFEDEHAEGTGEGAEPGTRVTYAAAYELPSRVLETAARPFVERYNARELRTTLENLRDHFRT